MQRHFKQLLFERERVHSSDRSNKTGGRLNPNLEYSDDFDAGPSRISSARRRQGKQGYDCKYVDENLNPLYRFLGSSLGRPWNDVYSEIRQRINPRDRNSYRILLSLRHIVKHTVRIGNDGLPYYVGHLSGRYSSVQVNGYYVHPATGVLLEHRTDTWKRRSRRALQKSTTRIKRWENSYFELVELRKAHDGCTFFPYWIKKGTKEKVATIPYNHERYYDPVCQHGLQPETVRWIWYVVDYTYRNPEDIYKVYRFEDGECVQKQFGLTEPGQRHVIRWKDRPHELALSLVVVAKQANRKQLKDIRKALAVTSLT